MLGAGPASVLSVALCVTVLIASEFMPVSLLTPIASDLQMTEGLAGQTISISGIFAVLTSLVVSGVTARLDRRTVLLCLTALMVVSGTSWPSPRTSRRVLLGRAPGGRGPGVAVRDPAVDAIGALDRDHERLHASPTAGGRLRDGGDALLFMGQFALLRPALAARDRSLVTVSALIAAGQVAQVTFHLTRAMDSGLTREEAGEVITHVVLRGLANRVRGSAGGQGCLRQAHAVTVKEQSA